MVQITTSYKARAWAQREEEIVRAARRLIRSGGASHFSMDTLAEAVGVSKPTLYQHFRSKEDVIVRALVYTIEEMETYLGSTAALPPLERLTKTLRMILSQRYSEGGFHTDYESETIFASLHARPEVASAKHQTLRVVETVIDEGKARGEIVTSVPTPIIGCLFFKLIGLPATVMLLTPPDVTGRADEDDHATILEPVVELFVRSIAIP
jgi:AcrR family transcriptional regulator